MRYRFASTEGTRAAVAAKQDVDHKEREAVARAKAERKAKDAA